MDNNHAIIEVKSSRASSFGIRKDLATLDQFLIEVGYERAIYLFYGEEIDLDFVLRLAAERPVQGHIEIWLHSKPGSPAEQIADIPPR